MKSLIITSLAIGSVACASYLHNASLAQDSPDVGLRQPPQEAPDPQEAPAVPVPQAEHQWLERFVGEWEFTTSVYLDPDSPPMTASGTETVRGVGGFWIIGESTSEFMGMTMTNVITIGYDPQKEKYIGMSVDSTSPHVTNYEGTVNEAGNRLTLTWQGPSPRQPGQMVTFRGVTEFKSDDHRVFTAHTRDDAGQWSRIVQVDFRRTE